MPDYTVSADVDSMLRSANDAAIRSAIGVGTTDAPTFLAQTLTGQSLTGTQATSLVDLAATWNTTGNPSLIYGRVTNTNSGASANLIDLGTFAGGSLFSVRKDGLVTAGLRFNIGTAGMWETGMSVGASLSYSWSSTSTYTSTADLILARDAAGILAQRNGTNAQAFRVYNTFPGTTANEWFEIDWKTTANSVRIGTNQAGTGGTRQMILTGGGGSTPGFQFNVGAAATWIIDAAGAFKAGFDNTFDIGASGANRPRNIYVANAIIAGSIGGASGADLIFNGASVGAAWKLTPAGSIVAQVDNTYDIGASGANRPRTIYVATSIIGSAGAGILGGGAFQLNNSRGTLYAAADGVLTLANQAGASFDRLQLGGTTDAFPAIARDGAGIKITGAAAGLTSWIKVPAVAVASLPLAATAGVGARSFVNDALTPVFGSAVTGGGAVTVPVYSTGSAWNVG